MGNAGTGDLPKVRAWRAAPQNLLDFAFTRYKIKPKQKDFCYRAVERQVCAAPALHIARALATSLGNKQNIRNRNGICNFD